MVISHYSVIIVSIFIPVYTEFSVVYFYVTVIDVLHKIKQN
jgi:hypothetical protein